MPPDTSDVGNPERALTRERCTAIARMVLDNDVSEQDVVECAEWIRRTAATLPPLSAEQRDMIAVLLRPSPTGKEGNVKP